MWNKTEAALDVAALELAKTAPVWQPSNTKGGPLDSAATEYLIRRMSEKTGRQVPLSNPPVTFTYYCDDPSLVDVACRVIKSGELADLYDTDGRWRKLYDASVEFMRYHLSGGQAPR